MVNQIIGAFVGCGLITLGIVMEGGQPATLVNWNALLITVGGAFGATLMCCSPAAFIAAFSHALTGRNSGGNSHDVFANLSRNLFYCGTVGFLYGAIHTLGNMGDWNQFGAGLAVALLSPLYAVLLRTFVAIPFAERTRPAGSGDRHGEQRHLRVA